MAPKQDLHAVLGVSRAASKDEIKAAFKKCALRLHPDKNPDDPERATAEFKKVSEAYRTLMDPQAKREYESERDAPSFTSSRQRNTSTYAGSFAYSRRKSDPEGRDFVPDPPPAPPPRKFDFKDVMSNDFEMQGKKGGFEGDFEAYLKKAEAERDGLAAKAKEQELQRQREEMAQEARATRAMDERQRSTASEVRENWQKELREIERERAEQAIRAEEERVAKARADMAKREEEGSEQRRWADEMLERTKREREALKRQRMLKGIQLPAPGEMRGKSDEELNLLKAALQETLAAVEKEQKSRRESHQKV